MINIYNMFLPCLLLSTIICLTFILSIFNSILFLKIFTLKHLDIINFSRILSNG